MQRWIQGRRADAGDNEHVAIGLEAGPERPLHLPIGENIDVGINREYVLHTDCSQTV